jgi:hypothetical protein
MPFFQKANPKKFTEGELSKIKIRVYPEKPHEKARH